MSTSNPDSYPSLQSVIDQLTSVAIDTGADFKSMTQLQLFGGMTLIVHWSPSGGDHYTSLPREAHLVFSTDTDPKGRFQIGFCYDPVRWLHCQEEGLPDNVCDKESQRIVENMEAVVNYLTGRPYIYLKKGEKRRVDKTR